MMPDGKNEKMAVSNDIESVVAQLTALREDMANLAQSVATIADRRGRKMAADISDGVGEALHYVERKGVSAEARLENSVAAHPLMALGIAAGAGLLIGILSRR